jgi:hypothetical protein
LPWCAQWLDDRGITPYIRVKERPTPTRDLYGIEKFTYVPEENYYLCPEGKPLNSRVHAKTAVHARQLPDCLDSRLRSARRKAYEIARTPQFVEALRKRRKVEALFSELKNQIGLRR